MQNSESFEPVDFDQVAVGDRLRFVTADNGFGGTGQVWRTGVVTRITANTVYVACDSNRVGASASLSRKGWRARAVSREVS